MSLGVGTFRDVIVACNRITEVAFRSYFSRLPKIICFPLFSSFPAWVRPDTAREREFAMNTPRDDKANTQPFIQKVLRISTGFYGLGIDGL